MWDRFDLNTAMLFGIALSNAAGLYFSWRAKSIAVTTSETVAVLEKNTNSIKDALVAKTGEAAHAAGREEMRIEGEAKAATLAMGLIEGKK